LQNSGQRTLQTAIEKRPYNKQLRIVEQRLELSNIWIVH